MAAGAGGGIGGGGATYPARVGDAHCDEGWGGEDCSEPRCGVVGSGGGGGGPGSVGGSVGGDGCAHGKCLSPPFCTCEDGYSGPSCELVECAVRCDHGSCTNPEFCACDAGWLGQACDAECDHGDFSVASQNCTCHPGWFGSGCKRARCEQGCVNGECVAPGTCRCHSGFDLADCSVDAVKVHAGELMDGLRVRLAPRLASLTVTQSADDKVRAAAQEWAARSRSGGGAGGGGGGSGNGGVGSGNGGGGDGGGGGGDDWDSEELRRPIVGPWLPSYDALAARLRQRFPSCALVGNSGGLLTTELGDVLNEHEAG